MKKLFILSAVVAILGSCNGGKPSASLKNDIDTLSYEMGLSQSQGVRDYLTYQLGIDSTYLDDFLKGVVEGANAGDDKKQAAYYAGIQIGQQISTQMIKGLNYELFGEDSTKTVSVQNVLAGFIDGASGAKDPAIALETAKKELNTRMEALRAKALNEKYGANKVAGEKFLAANKKKAGVITLPSGLQYKVIKEGTGVIPSDTSTVYVSYEGRLVNDSIFDSSYKNNAGEPVRLEANRVIKGWTEALTRMPAGSVWELYIPQELAYGTREYGKITPFSTLIFKLELVRVGEK